MLESKLDDEGRMIVERPHRGLKGLEFCARGRVSELATARFRQLRGNLSA